MQLTKLEIKGFKSFGDKAVINFDKGITGIVGPNGCGKSNVVDSIRWVLGEQKSRMLRSDKMENVIFNGTKKRKPTQLAEVSLTFANTKNILPTEYTTVTITRRYYRSGESEYLLNGVTCRLKDITNLFMDTGISSNSYAIIELKMVDDILNDKEGSRRALFEEAAGISKFKVRKKETLRKLNDTDADLDRVEDLLFEIEKNLKSLERQAKQTERFYKAKENYKVLSIALARKTISRHQESYERLKKDITAEEDKKLSLNKQLNEAEASIEQAKTDLVTKEKLLSSRQKTLNEHVNKIRQYESDKKIKNERLRYLEDRSDKLKEQLETDRKSNERATFSIQSLEREHEVAEKLFRETEAKLEELRTAFEEQKQKTGSIRARNEAIEKQLREKQNESYQLGKELEVKQIQLSTLKQELEKSTYDTSEKSASMAEFQEKITELSDILSQKNNQYERLKKAEEDLQTRLEDTENTLNMVREEMAQVNRKLDARQNEYNLTKSLVDNLEGFPDAIKFLKKKSSWGKDVPLLSDIITCDDEYRITIENYLEPILNYYIVETEQQALEAVNLLSDAARGKANFFVLERINQFKSSEPRIFPNARPATEIMEYDSKYRKLIAYILDKVYVVAGDSSDMPQDTDSIFITKSGKLTIRPYSITGGSVGLFEGKRIGRAKNLEKLDKEIKSLQQRQEEIRDTQAQKQQEMVRLRESSNKGQLEELQQEIRGINEEYISLKTKHEQYSEMLSSQATRREDIQDRIEELSEALETLQPRAEETKTLLVDLEEESTTVQEELHIQNELLSEKSQTFNQENILFHQQQNKVNSIEQEINFKQSAADSSKERIGKGQEELKGIEAEIAKLIESAEFNDDQLIAMYEEKETIEQGVNEAEKEYYAVRGQIDEGEKRAREVRRQRELLDTVIGELRDKINDTKLELNSVKERLSVEFNINIDEILKRDDAPEEGEEEQEKPEITVPEDEGELRAQVEKIRQRMDNMGPINPMAMEAYQEIKERHDFITTQKDDLIKAKESLLATIGEIDLVARETFMEAFLAIQENFMKVFRSLFTEEDDCSLSLTDPDNPLESSIEIMAKPKGKRPLTINQLSGGEKTLTATSLLFAIYLLKPAPFCIFDEVDAPLDDANIDKFNNIIRDFSSDSQFIIVTHNKRTMASTDIIYGVTMIEQGVSRVVPVDLRELA